MKAMKNFFVFLYSISPLIVIPCLAYKEQNWYILFGILFCYLGVAIAAYKSSLLTLAILFCIGFWIKDGFNIHQYVTLFFFCMLGGFVFFKMADQYDSLHDQKVNPEKYKEFAEIESKIKSALEAYKLGHPNEPLTPEKTEEIKNKIIYGDALEQLKK